MRPHAWLRVLALLPAPPASLIASRVSQLFLSLCLVISPPLPASLHPSLVFFRFSDSFFSFFLDFRPRAAVLGSASGASFPPSTSCSAVGLCAQRRRHCPPPVATGRRSSPPASQALVTTREAAQRQLSSPRAVPAARRLTTPPGSLERSLSAVTSNLQQAATAATSGRSRVNRSRV